MTTNEIMALVRNMASDDEIRAAVEAMAAEIETLKRWKSTHAPRIEALAGLLEISQKDAAAGQEAIASLQSERDANAILTQELESTKALNRLGQGIKESVGHKALQAELEAAKSARDAFENHFLEVSQQYCEVKQKLEAANQAGLWATEGALQYQQERDEWKKDYKGAVEIASQYKQELEAAKQEGERLREVWLEDSVRASEDRGDLLKERDALQAKLTEAQFEALSAMNLAIERKAKLDALEKQEPVAVVKENPFTPEGMSDDLGTYLPNGMKLYAAAGAAHKEKQE